MTATDAALHLHEIAEALPFIPLAQDTRIPGTAAGGKSTGGSKPPMKLGPWALVEDIADISGSWVADLMGPSWDGVIDWSMMPVTWKVETLELLAPEVETYHPAAKDFGKEFRTLRNRAKEMIGERNLKLTCPHCGGRLQGLGKGRVEVDHYEDWREVFCTVCEAALEFDHDLRELAKVDRMTVRQWSDELCIDYEVLRKRLNRAGVAPIGMDGPRKLYSRDQLSAVVSEAA